MFRKYEKCVKINGAPNLSLEQTQNRIFCKDSKLIALNLFDKAISGDEFWVLA